MKKQNQKKHNPFKVNHVRSLRVKAKAQPIKGQLKNLKDLINKKVNAVDEDLKALGEIVRQPIKPNSTVQQNAKPDSVVSNSQLIENYEMTEKNTEDALKRLETWNCEK